ncbi:hypothetical protein [Paracoccus marinus]|uniref:hypothetical protein n=1 Tax=Paracoccus marinus TaxID=288426 RepID=UPI00117EDFAF|nr:hypothetical protein [Paracoccus marinus]
MTPETPDSPDRDADGRDETRIAEGGNMDIKGDGDPARSGRQAASPPVLTLRDLDAAGARHAPGGADADAPALPPIGSSLVGDGDDGLPPAARKTDAGLAASGPSDPDSARLSDAEMADAFEGERDDRFRADAAGRLDEPSAPPSDAGRAEPARAFEPATVSSLPASPMPVSPMPAAVRPAPKARRSGGFGGLVLGGVIAAALGAGAAWWALPRLPAAWQPGPPAPVVDAAALSADLQARTQATVDAALANVRTDAAAAAIAAAQGELSAQAEGIAARAAEAATAAADPAVRSALAAMPTPELGQETVQSLSQAAAAAGAEAGAEAARRIIAESPASDTPANLNATLSAQASQIAALGQAVDDLRAALPADLAQRLDSQKAALDELSARPTIDPETAQRVQQVADSVAQAQAQLRQATEAATAELARVRAEAAALKDASAEAARRARTAAAAATLSSALTTGQPGATGGRDAAVAQLEQAGVAVPQALTAEIVPLDQLQASFADAARAGLGASLGAGDTGGSALGNFLRAQTGARSVEPREGGDPDAILSRADAAVARGDIAAALTEIDGLPEPGRAAMKGWTDQARAWQAASGAVAGLTAPAATAASPTSPAAPQTTPPAPASAPAPAPVSN